MRSAPVFLTLLACGGGAKHAPTPGDPDPTPPGGDGFVAEEINQEQITDCTRHDLAIRVVAGGAVADEQLLSGECRGACTPEAKAEGEAQVAEIEARIAAGEGSESELDYNFTACEHYGFTVVDWEELDGVGKLAVIQGHDAGAHDIPNVYYQLAFAQCGKVWIGQPFGQTYANRWTPEDLGVTHDADARVIQVMVLAGETGHELYRVEYDAEPCDAPPVDTVSDAEEILY